MITTNRQATEAVHAMVEPIVAHVGFTASEPLVYLKSRGDQNWVIAVAARCPSPMNACFSIGGSIEFLQLARWIDQSRFTNVNRVGTTCASFTDKGGLLEWTFSSHDELRSYMPRVQRAIENEATPFFEKYSCVDNVLAALVRDESSYWTNLGHGWVSRVILNAAIHMSRGRREEAERAFDSGLAAMKHLRPVYRQNVEAAKSYMLAQTGKESQGA